MRKVNVNLMDHEMAASVDQITGEIKMIFPRENSNNPMQGYMQVNTPFRKSFDAGWEYLVDLLTARQMKLAMIMSYKTKPLTNSLQPFNDKTTVRNLAEAFKTNKNTVKKDLEVLFKYGVYARFDVMEDKFKHTKFWAFNPYLAYNGKTMHKSTLTLFDNTTIAIIVKGKRS